MKTQAWGNAFPIAQHATLESISQGRTVEKQENHLPNIADLAAGDSVQFQTASALERYSWNQDDQLYFKNGAVVQDLPGESGLQITSPDGRVTTAQGWVDRDEQGPCVHTRTFVAEHEEWMTWKQTFPPEGGVVMERQPERGGPDRNVTISPNGEVKATGLEWNEPVVFQGSVEGNALVLRHGDKGEATVPAVPLQWLIKK